MERESDAVDPEGERLDRAPHRTVSHRGAVPRRKQKVLLSGDFDPSIAAGRTDETTRLFSISLTNWFRSGAGALGARENSWLRSPFEDGRLQPS
jgi:hypothetical protein